MSRQIHHSNDGFMLVSKNKRYDRSEIKKVSTPLSSKHAVMADKKVKTHSVSKGAKKKRALATKFINWYSSENVVQSSIQECVDGDLIDLDNLCKILKIDAINCSNLIDMIDTVVTKHVNVATAYNILNEDQHIGIEDLERLIKFTLDNYSSSRDLLDEIIIPLFKEEQHTTECKVKRGKTCRSNNCANYPYNIDEELNVRVLCQRFKSMPHKYKSAIDSIKKNIFEKLTFYEYKEVLGFDHLQSSDLLLLINHISEENKEIINVICDIITKTTSINVYKFYTYLDPQVQLELMYLLLQRTPQQINYIDLLKTIVKEKAFPRKQTTESTGWAHYNAIAWWNEGIDKKMVTEVVNLLHQASFDIFIENVWGETALQSVLQKHKEGLISFDEMEYRYSRIADIQPNQIRKLVASTLNKLTTGNNTDKFIDRLRFAFVQNPTITIECFVRSLLCRQLPKLTYIKSETQIAQYTHDSHLRKYVSYLFASLSGIDTGYKTVNISSPELNLFFKNNKCSMNYATIMKSIIDKLIEIGLQKTTGNYIELVWEASVVLLAEIAHNGVHQQVCNNLFKMLLSREEVESSLPCLNASDDIKVRMVIRALIQYGQCSTVLKELLINVYNIGNIEPVTLSLIECFSEQFNIKLSKKLMKKEKPEDIPESEKKIILPVLFNNDDIKESLSKIEQLQRNTDHLKLAEHILLQLFDKYQEKHLQIVLDVVTHLKKQLPLLSAYNNLEDDGILDDVAIDYPWLKKMYPHVKSKLI